MRVAFVRGNHYDAIVRTMPGDIDDDGSAGSVQNDCGQDRVISHEVEGE